MDHEVGVGAVRASYLRIYAPLWRSVLGWAGSAEVADEAVAEAFAQAVRRGEAIRDVDAWVWRSAFRIAAGELARRRRVDLRAEVPDGGALADRVDPLAAEVVVALGCLSPHQRACVVLRDIGGLDPAEVAAALGTSPGAVRVAHHRGRSRLRRLLEETDHG